MKYTSEVTINKPITQVWDFFIDESKTKLWQPTYLSTEVIEGKRGEVGSKNKMKFNNKGKVMEMMEEIVEKIPNKKFTAIYRAPNVYNYNEIEFSSVNQDQTHLKMITEFKFSSFMKIIGFVFRGAFVKESQNNLDLIKSACEL